MSNVINIAPLVQVVSDLKQLIKLPSFSREEGATADYLFALLESNGCIVNRHINNVWCRNKYYDAALPSLLLCSHHDTVKPGEDYQRNPFDPSVEDGKLFGLGSNDAGASLMCLLHTFLEFYARENLAYNLVFAAVAEEEVSGKNGVEAVLPLLGRIDAAIVGEPTGLNMAVAERGLMVVDAIAKGTAAHAAHLNPNNAISNAIADIHFINSYKFTSASPWLGEVSMNVTMIQAGTQHNTIPDECKFTVDIRSTDVVSNEEILKVLSDNLKAELFPRSMRLRPSAISEEHILMKAADALKLKKYGSPTLSDQALMNFPSVKIGPGESTRSHTADEFVLISEVEKGLQIYYELVNFVVNDVNNTLGQ